MDINKAPSNVDYEVQRLYDAVARIKTDLAKLNERCDELKVTADDIATLIFMRKMLGGTRDDDESFE